MIDSLNTADNNHKYSKFLCIENTIHIFQITTRISWASIEKRNSIGFRFLVIVLGAIGAFFSLIWLIQDVTWFTWGVMGGDSGLYSLGMAGIHNFSLNPLVFWTFEYSQLVQSINLAFNHLQVDLFLFKLLGPIVTALVLSVIIIPLVFILKSVVNNSKLYVNKNT